MDNYRRCLKGPVGNNGGIPSKGRGLFEKRLGLPEAAYPHPKLVPMHKTTPIPSQECYPEYTEPQTSTEAASSPGMDYISTLLRDTPYSESTPRLLSQEGRAKAKHPPVSPWAGDITSLTSLLSQCKGQNTMPHKKLPHLGQSGLARVLRRTKTPSFLLLSIPLLCSRYTLGGLT